MSGRVNEWEFHRLGDVAHVLYGRAPLGTRYQAHCSCGWNCDDLSPDPFMAKERALDHMKGAPIVRGRRSEILNAIDVERDRQLRKFGDQHHLGRLFVFAALAEEFGEVAKEVTEEAAHDVTDLTQLREELIQLAAMTLQMVEYVDRDIQAATR